MMDPRAMLDLLACLAPMVLLVQMARKDNKEKQFMETQEILEQMELQDLKEKRGHWVIQESPDPRVFLVQWHARLLALLDRRAVLVIQVQWACLG